MIMHTLIFYIIIIIIIIIINCKWVVPGGSGTTIHNTTQYTKNTKKQNNTYTLKTIHNAIITNTNTVATLKVWSL